MTKSTNRQRTRLTHQQYHQVAMFCLQAVNPDTRHIDATPSAMVTLVAQELHIATNPQQLRDICKEENLTIRPDTKAASNLGDVELALVSHEKSIVSIMDSIDLVTTHQQQLGATVTALVAQVTDLTQQVGNINSQLADITDTAGLVDSAGANSMAEQRIVVEAHAGDIANIKKVLNDHAKRLTSWAPAAAPAAK